MEEMRGRGFSELFSTSVKDARVADLWDQNVEGGCWNTLFTRQNNNWEQGDCNCRRLEGM